MSKIKVEDVEFPENPLGRTLVYPWNELEVGKSFSVPAEKASSVVQAGYRYFNRRNIKVSLRKAQDEKNDNNRRIFRVK